MTTLRLCSLMSLVPLALLAACGTEPDANPLALEAHSFANSEWSAPMNLGETINTAAVEANPTLSPDELSLYFLSDRSLGYGGTDIWVSRRACETCPWEEPDNLGSLINTSGNEGAPSIFLDGHLDRKSTRLNSSHGYISYAVFCLKKKKNRLHKSIHRTHA